MNQDKLTTEPPRPDSLTGKERFIANVSRVSGLGIAIICSLARAGAESPLVQVTPTPQSKETLMIGIFTGALIYFGGALYEISHKQNVILRHLDAGNHDQT